MAAGGSGGDGCVTCVGGRVKMVEIRFCKGTVLYRVLSEGLRCDKKVPNIEVEQCLKRGLLLKHGLM